MSPRPLGSRSGVTLIEMMVAFTLVAFLFGYIASGSFHARQAANLTDRVGVLQEVRRVLTLVTMDLQTAVVIERPGWGTTCLDAQYLGPTHQRVRYQAELADGTVLTDTDAARALPIDVPVHIVRVTTQPDGTQEREQLDRRGLPLAWFSFYRLGRNLIGFRLALKPDPDSPVVARRQGEEYSAVISLNRQLH